MSKLTKGFIDSLPVPEKGTKTYWHDQPRGLGVRITRFGTKTFVVIKRFRGRLITVTIGPYGVYTLKQACKEANKVIRQIDKGKDPRKARKQKEAKGITLKELAAEYTSRPGKLKPRSAEVITRHVETTFEDMADRPVVKIDEEYCRARYRKMLEHGLRGKKGAPSQANQSNANLNTLINYAIRQHKLPMEKNMPANAIIDDKVPTGERESFIPASKIGAVWNYLVERREKAYTHAELSGIDVAMFMLLTGNRIGAVSRLTWDRVNLEEAWWHVPKEHAKNNRATWFPLAKQAVTLLEQRPRRDGNPFVFIGKDRESHIKDPRSVWQGISKIAGEGISSHDCRRTLFNNGLAELHLDYYKLSLIVGHTLQGVAAKHYAQFMLSRLQWLQPEAQQWADWIELKAAQASGCNVVALPMKG